MRPSTILVCAGRRIDAPDASPSRFPLSQIEYVCRQVGAVLQEQRVTMVVSSAACGADLIVLEMARSFGIRFRILLPNSPEQFRTSSVTDRPSSVKWNWGVLYDQLIELAQTVGDLKILEGTPEGHRGYQAVNRALVLEAMRLGEQHPGAAVGSQSVQVQALMIWDGRPRGPQDLTLHFGKEARAHELPVLEILTYPTSQPGGRYADSNTGPTPL